MPLPPPQPGDYPVDADYDHDGIADAAVWRSSDSSWYVEPSSGGPTWQRTVGLVTKPATPDEADGLRVLAGALSTLAGQLWSAGDQAGTVAAAQERVKIFDRLAAADPTIYRPMLASALMEEVLYGAADRAGALAAAERGVQIWQELAGITPDGYADLSGLTPNAAWEQLATALSYLGQARDSAGEKSAGLAAVRNRVRVIERLAAPDRPVADQQRFRPMLASALMEEVLYGAADRAGALAAAERGVQIWQELAGITPDGYADLSGLTPNAAWEQLATALSYLGQARDSAGEKSAGLAAVRNRVRVIERLAAPDRPVADQQRFRPMLASALMEEVLYGAADRAGALAAAERGVQIWQELAGITPDGYADLSGLTPNAAWEQLATALSYLGQARDSAGEKSAGLAAVRNRVRVIERLAAPDRPVADQQRFRPMLASALMEEVLYGAADRAGTLAAAERGVQICQELAGIHSGNYDAPATERLDAYLLRAARGVSPDPATADLVEFRAALLSLAELPVASLERLMAQSIDLASHRLDAWITSFATQRLDWLRSPQGSRAAGVGIGGYGWLEDLQPRKPPTTADALPDEPAPLLRDPNSAGFVHAPSLAHATTAAVLRGGEHAYYHDGASPYAIDLRSHRVQLAEYLLDGIRQGQPLGALLGYRLERALHEHPLIGLAAYLPPLRTLYPRRVTALSAEEGTQQSVRTVEVVDGLALHRDWQQQRLHLIEQLGVTDTVERDALIEVFDGLAETVDALADALLAEGVHHIVQGNPLRAGAALDAADRGEAPPPELDVARTPRTGITLTHRLLVVLTKDTVEPAGWPLDLHVQARAQAEPRLNAWLATLLPAPARVRYRAEAVGAADGHVIRVENDLRALRISPLDLVAMPERDPDASRSELDLRLIAAVRELSEIGLAAQVRLDLTRDPAWPPDVISVAELLEVLRALRALLDLTRPLERRDITLPESGQPEQETDPAMAERAQRAAEALSEARGDLAVGVDDDRLRQGLRRAAHLGVAGALPDTAPLRTTADLAASELTRRQAALDQLDSDRANGKLTQLGYDRARLNAVFGSGFHVLPTLPADATLAAALGGSLAAQGGDMRAALGWLHRIARVRRGADRLTATFSYAEALGTGADLTLDVAQLPHSPDERWLGLPFQANPPQGNRLSLLVHAPDDVTQAFAGLAVDEWTEVIPSRTELTGVAFHYDAPGASPPQAVLLAVSPDARERWSTELLEETLAEALSLTHLRAVDLEALHPSDPDDMTDVGQLLPAAHLATNVSVGDAIATDLTRGSA